MAYNAELFSKEDRSYPPSTDFAIRINPPVIIDETTITSYFSGVVSKNIVARNATFLEINVPASASLSADDEKFTCYKDPQEYPDYLSHDDRVMNAAENLKLLLDDLGRIDDLGNQNWAGINMEKINLSRSREG